MKKHMITELIHKDGYYFIYGDYKGEYQILFQSPILSDVEAYIERERLCVEFKVDEATEDLYEVEGYNLVDYYRLYFRGGWYGRWMNLDPNPLPEHKATKEECEGVNNIINFLIKHFPYGCDFSMTSFLRKYPNWGVDEQRWLLAPNKYYKVMFDTKYGNGDYPVRIYVYREKANE